MEKRLSVLNGVHSCPRAVAHWSRPELEKPNKDTSRLLSNKGCANENVQSESKQPMLSVKDFSPPNPLKTFPPSKHNLLRKNSFDSDSCLNEMILAEETPFFGDQKSLIKGFQTIEMINRILANYKDGKDQLNELDYGFLNFIHNSMQIKISNDAKFSSQNVQSLAFFHDKLIHLLKDRCYLGLQKDCLLQTKELKSFVVELIALACDEKERVQLHLLGNGKSISGLYFGKHCKLLEHLEHQCSRWPMIQQHLNRMISIFHVSWDCRLNTVLSHTERILKSLVTEAFFWTLMILKDDFMVLCSKDQHTLPSDVLQNFYNSLHVYNNLLGSQLNESSGFNLCKLCLENKQCVHCQMQVFTNSFALEMLATFQSRIAAGNIVDVLTAEWRNCEYLEMELGVNWLTEMQELEKTCPDNCVSSSDYYTMSETASSSNTKDSSDPNRDGEFNAFSLNSALLKVIQKNQTSLLKHLFTMTCIGSFPFGGRAKIIDKGKPVTVGRQKWPKATPKFGSESSSHLEQVYWVHFWKELEYSIFSLTLYSSGLPLKNSRLGNTSFLPPQFVIFCNKKSKIIKSDPDLCTEAVNTMQRVSQKLLITTAKGCWDEYLNKALKCSTSNRYVPVPLENGNVGTNVGKLLYFALEPATFFTLSAYSLNENSTNALALSCLQSTVDFIISWSSSKLYCFLNCWHISTFLLIALTDLTNCCKLLMLLAELYSTFQDSNVIDSWRSFWVLDVQIQILKEFIDCSDDRIFQRTYSQCSDILKSVFPKARYWRRRKLESKLGTLYKEEMLEDILNPALNTLSSVSSGRRLAVTRVISSAWAQAIVDYIFNRRIYFSPIGAYQFKCDVYFILGWIQESGVNAAVAGEFLKSDGFLKLNAVLNILRGDEDRIKTALKSNQVAPSEFELRNGQTYIYISNIQTQIHEDLPVITGDHQRWSKLTKKWSSEKTLIGLQKSQFKKYIHEVLPAWNLSAMEIEMWKSLKIYHPVWCLFCFD